MADFLEPGERSRRMGRIRSQDTRPEIILRRALHELGLRFRLGGAGLPGRPDIVLPRHRAVVFVHGCFWHRHRGCKVASTPKSNTGFWTAKFDRNVERDAKVTRELEALGWRVFVAWECELTVKSRLGLTAAGLARRIRGEPGAPEVASTF
ncbi:very short patch repair endonuclease [Sphingosinicella humi]|uniref:Very short patch repair endonuclease n=1 Tax=Allosphingosinicella humi TaxID=2068657 RepID=A0A2U2J1H5_9SPHN|nr:very short patch repair endonuclease [Sphingosinicella humi]